MLCSHRSNKEEDPLENQCHYTHDRNVEARLPSSPELDHIRKPEVSRISSEACFNE